jgi:hypothetical protein
MPAPVFIIITATTDAVIATGGKPSISAERVGVASEQA